MSNENRFSFVSGFNSGDTSKPKKGKTQDKKHTDSSAQKPGKESSKAKYKDKQNYKQVGLYLPVDVHQRMKIGAAMTGKEMSDIASEAVQLWLKENVPNI